MKIKIYPLLFIFCAILTIISCDILLSSWDPLGKHNRRFSTEKKLTALDTIFDRNFGSSISINGDFAIVGAEYDDTYTGAAYIFYRNQGGTDNWGQVKKLTASDPSIEDYFGHSVCISWDYVIVGAYGNGYGAAYIFYRNQGGTDNWGQVKKLTASDPAANDRFGFSVCMNGDYVIVGAYGKNSGTGAAYIFYRNQGGTDNWGQVKKLTASDPAANDRFGFSVCMNGDYAVVGAYANGCGAAYIFYRNQGGTDNWGQVKKLMASDPDTEDYFGYSVCMSGDYTIVGANAKNMATGAAYIFYRNKGGTDNWGQVKKLTASDPETGDYFGESLSISGDYAFVGADRKNSGAGAAYIFYRNQGGIDNWGKLKKFTASDSAVNDRFGFSVCMNGDYVIVGAPWKNSYKGAAYVYK